MYSCLRIDCCMVFVFLEPTFWSLLLESPKLLNMLIKLLLESLLLESLLLERTVVKLCLKNITKNWQTMYCLIIFLLL